MTQKIAAFATVSLSLALLGSLTAFAFQSTSTNFSLCGNTAYIVGNSTSSNFGLFSYGQIDAMPISTSGNFMVNPGIEAIFGCAVTSSSSPSISLAVSPSTITLPGLSPGIGSPVVASTTVTVSVTGSTDGYSLEIQNSSTTITTLSSSTITFPDYTPLWVLTGGTTCGTGSGNGTTTPGQTFSFRVESASTSADYCSSWWGSGDTSTAKYTGMPTTPTTIVNSTSPSSQTGVTTVSVVFRADAPITQKATSYSGSVIITVLTNL